MSGINDHRRRSQHFSDRIQAFDPFYSALWLKRLCNRVLRCRPFQPHRLGIRFLLGLGLALGLATLTLATAILQPMSYSVANALSESVELGHDTRLFGTPDMPQGDRAALISAIDHSLSYLNSAAAQQAYADYAIPGITRDRVRRSVSRFRELVQQSCTPEALQQAVAENFEFYRSTGNNGQGRVAFTGYFEPTYAASRVPTETYRYPLYQAPRDLSQWPQPHPTRAELEGVDGLQASQGPLQGLELVWLRDRLEAFLVQVQGSARLQLTDGSVMSVGYAGRTDYAYTSLGRLLINDGKVREEDLSLPVLLDYFQANPEALNQYLPQNNRFVFFRATNGEPPTGSLSVPVTANRSIATDKSLMPPGALALINVALPTRQQSEDWQFIPISAYVLDQDTGGAIRGPGRVDLFIGTGTEAGDRAGLINTDGSLYYLLLKE